MALSAQMSRCNLSLLETGDVPAYEGWKIRIAAALGVQPTDLDAPVGSPIPAAALAAREARGAAARHIDDPPESQDTAPE